MQEAQSGCRVARSALVAMAASGFLQTAAMAGSDTSDLVSSPAPSLPDALRQLADLAGLRSRLEQAGLQFTFTYYGDAFANRFSGVTQGFGYDGRFGTIIDADLEKLLGWSGAAFHASIHQIHGTQYSATDLQNLALVSGIEAPPSTRLFNLWFEQKVGSHANLRVRQFSAAQEFLVSQNAALFLNSTFGWPLLPGGASYLVAWPAKKRETSGTPFDEGTLEGVAKLSSCPASTPLPQWLP